MAADGEVVLRARPVARWVWALTWTLFAAVAVVPAVLQPSESADSFLVDAAVYGLVWGIPVWVALITIWSIDFYGTVTLTPSTLRVGRETVPVADLDPVGSRAVDRGTPSLGRRIGASGGQLQLPGMPVSGIRYLGGSWGTPYGMDAVTLPLRDGSGVQFYVRDRASLLAALDGVLPEA